KINLLQNHLFTSLNGAIQEEATVAVSRPQDYIIDERVATYDTRRNGFVNSLRFISSDVKAPTATFFAWFKVHKQYTSSEFAELRLEKAHVIVADGSGFGTLGEGYVRMGLLDTEERLQEAAERIGKLDIAFD